MLTPRERQGTPDARYGCLDRSALSRPIVAAGKVALEAAHGLHPCLALGLLFGEELAGRGIAAALGDGDAVKGPVS
jgi:hypothetical protein